MLHSHIIICFAVTIMHVSDALTSNKTLSRVMHLIRANSNCHLLKQHLPPSLATLSIRTPDGQIQQSHFFRSTYPFEHARIYSKPCLLLFFPCLLLFFPFLLLFCPFILLSVHLFFLHRCCSHSDPQYLYINTNKR